MTSSVLPGRPSRFPGVDTSLRVEELRVREERSEVLDGETNKFLRHFKSWFLGFESVVKRSERKFKREKPTHLSSILWKGDSSNYH